MEKQIHVFYTGMVQGVGFRFTTEDIAKDLGVCGWVKNLALGGVEIMAQAPEDVLKEFLSRINQHFSHYIRDVDILWFPASNEFKKFSIEL